MKKFLITTPIYYASGAPHIGHAYTTLLADVINRYKQLIGYETFFITGMDEHGQKIETLAAKNNVNEQEFVDRNCHKFQELFKELDIKYNFFIRTTNPQHIKAVQTIFTAMVNNDDIYLDKWQGYYCVSCEENYTLGQVKNVDGKLLCSVGHEIVQKNEESFFFNMKKYQSWLIEFLNNHPNFILPQHRASELRNNFLNDLNDLSVSRTTIKWGIKINENPDHVIYVWLDALFNYLTAQGYLSNDDSVYQKFWNDPETEKLHLMSKEITRFHCIYWPIFLHSLKLNLPTQILSHGWIITKEGKMSKSLGNVIDPFMLIKEFGKDQLRYFLMKEIDLNRDSIFNTQNFLETINADLANNIGNLLNRTLGMLKKYYEQQIPEYLEPNNPIILKLANENIELLNKLNTLVNTYQINEIINQSINLVKSANKCIEELKPWELAKNNQKDVLDCLIYHLCVTIRTIIYVLSPVLVDGCASMASQLNIDLTKLDVKTCLNFKNLGKIVTHEAKPIYPRIELKKCVN